MKNNKLVWQERGGTLESSRQYQSKNLMHSSLAVIMTQHRSIKCRAMSLTFELKTEQSCKNLNVPKIKKRQEAVTSKTLNLREPKKKKEKSDQKKKKKKREKGTNEKRKKKQHQISSIGIKCLDHVQQYRQWKLVPL